MKKKNLKVLYMSIKGAIILIALGIFKKYISFNDNNFYIKVLIYSIVVLSLSGLIHYIFMRLIFGKDDDRLQ